MSFMSRNTIRLDVERLIKQTGSTDPFEIFDYMNVIVQYDELGKDILGYTLRYKDVIIIVLNSRLSESENISLLVMSWDMSFADIH